MEENFEKKSSKKVWVIISVIIALLVAAVVAGLIYLNTTRKPEKIFAKAIEDTFEMSENVNAKSERMELELSLEIDANDAEMKAMNEMLKAVKLKLTTETDLDKEIFNGNISATYDGEQIISVDGLIQNEKMYFYLHELYSKYIEASEEDVDGVEISEIFAINPEMTGEDLVKDIKQILLDEVNSREFTQEDTELDGDDVQKSTLRLTPKEVLEITLKMLKKVNEYQQTTELSDLIEELEVEIEDLEDTENYVDISIYTKGLTNEVAKIDAVLVNVEDDEVIVIEMINNSENESVINFLMNEESTKVSEAQKLIEIEINTESENKGTVEMKMNVEEEYSVSLKVKYNVEYNVEIEERDTSNSININELTETDFNEMYLNAQENDILYSIIQLFMSSMEEQVYDYEYMY